VFLPHYRNLESNETSNNSSSCFPVVDFDAARSYVNELRESYGDIALFFYDLYGSTQVYVLFKPDATKPKEAKIANAKHSMLNSSSGKLELNLEAVIDDFKIIGSEFVQDVVILNQKIFQ
jgi:U3 small nucleolar RNA-associated protein 22